MWKVALGARGRGGAGVTGSRVSAAAPCRRSWKLTPISERGAGLQGALGRELDRGCLAGRLSSFPFLSRALFLDLSGRRPGEAWGRTGYRQGGARRERRFVTWIRHPSRSGVSGPGCWRKGVVEVPGTWAQVQCLPVNGQVNLGTIQIFFCKLTVLTFRVVFCIK